MTRLISRELEYHDFMRLKKIIQKIWSRLLSSLILCSDPQTGKVKPFCCRSEGNFDELPRSVINPLAAEQYEGENGETVYTSEHYLGLQQLRILVRHFACRQRWERGGLCNWLYLSVRSRSWPLQPCQSGRRALCPFPPGWGGTGWLPGACSPTATCLWSLQRWRELGWEMENPNLGAEPCYQN